MLRYVLVLLLLLCVAHAGAIVQITEFCADPYLAEDTDEYIVISGSGPLDAFTVSDGRGGFRFPKGTVLNGQVTIARSARAFNQSHGYYPDFEWTDTTKSVPDVIGGDPMRLANSKDELMLYENTVVVQSVSWPKDVRAREGQVHYLENGVWDPRPLMLGQTRVTGEVFHNATITAFVSPDCSTDVILNVINSSRHSVLLNVYEFSNPALIGSLLDAKKRGVDVKVLIEGGPVGGISADEKAGLYRLEHGGIPVFQMAGTAGTPAPYRYDHAKYIVTDQSGVLVTSENFRYSGFPPLGFSGNRGWGVYIEDAGTAGFFAGIFQSDYSGRSTIPYHGFEGKPEQMPSGKHTPEFFPGRFEGATVRPVIAPDTSSEILNLINSAGTSIEIEQAYIKNETTYGLNPYLSAAINASRRGVAVRVLLDSYWFNIEDEKDNDEMVAIINRFAEKEHLPLEARCADLDGTSIEKIHNKGVIVDGSRVLVSSINWNSNSPNFNREAGVIIDHPGVASYFRAAFESDWRPALKVQGPQTDYTKFLVAAIVIAGFVIFYFWRRKRF
jgi:phosphatidylserine/phosphatidylglycerophosphate/cardiolipin synthase-like enzyme